MKSTAKKLAVAGGGNKKVCPVKGVTSWCY